LRAGDDASARNTLRTGLVLAAVLAPLQILAGDLHGLIRSSISRRRSRRSRRSGNGEGRSALLFAVPDDERRRNVSPSNPEGASLVLRHDAEAEVQGIEAFVPDAAPVAPVFFAFRVMVGMGVLMLLAAWAACGRRARACCPTMMRGFLRASLSRGGSRRSPAGSSPRSAGSPGS